MKKGVKNGARTQVVGGPATPIVKFSPPNVDVTAEKQSFTASWGPLDDKPLPENENNDYYFNSYAHFGIHEEMLKDSVRTGAYQQAILNNKHLFKDKIVLDVGCGTGVLSMFAAQAGAKHVYAIECSNIVHIARGLIAHNKMSDKITLIHAKAEEAELPVDKVDIIVSEWMGYFLLYESMLDTVLYCRDRWLVKGGLIFPDRATLHIAAIEDGDYRREKFDFWNNVYGLDFTPVKKCIMEEAIVDHVQDQAIVTDSCCILDLNLNTCTVEDTNFVAPFRLKMSRQDYAHAFIAWFDCGFTACHNTIVFSTGPSAYATHWKQCVFYIEEPLTAMRNEEIQGWIAVRKNSKNHRDLDIKLSYTFSGQQHSVDNKTQFHRLR